MSYRLAFVFLTALRLSSGHVYDDTIAYVINHDPLLFVLEVYALGCDHATQQCMFPSYPRSSAAFMCICLYFTQGGRSLNYSHLTSMHLSTIHNYEKAINFIFGVKLYSLPASLGWPLLLLEGEGSANCQYSPLNRSTQLYLSIVKKFHPFTKQPVQTDVPSQLNAVSSPFVVCHLQRAADPGGGVHRRGDGHMGHGAARACSAVPEGRLP